MSERLNKHLHDALTAARLAATFLADVDLSLYEGDAMRHSAVERQLEIVGEAGCRAIDDTPELRHRLPELAKAVALRNRLSHGYDGVDHKIVFNTVKVHLPALILGLQAELAKGA
jgi:uncharacterized protein with HEPN domain